jgi:UDP-N-acetylglucosamine 2-epimerase (non-hydrolysing)
MKKAKKIIIIIGTRPEAIKLIPLYLELKERQQFEPVIISTGQHKEMLRQVFQFFNVKPDVDLNLMLAQQKLANITSLLFSAIQEQIDIKNPDLIIVQGDTQSAMVGALVGYYNQIKVAHIEAGLRTYNKFSPFPEEINRQTIGLVADYHFAPTQNAADNLLREGKSNVYKVGNTVIDALLLCMKIIQENREYYTCRFQNFLSFDKCVLITGHRRENFNGGLEQVTEAIAHLAEKFPNCCFIYPVHLNPRVQELVRPKLIAISNVFLIDPVGYDDLIFLLSQSFCVITDSGGIQEEAPSLNVPILVTRDTTERPEGIKSGCASLVGTDKEAIISKFTLLMNDEMLLNKMKNAPNPYGKGNSSEEIVAILEKDLF